MSNFAGIQHIDILSSSVFLSQGFTDSILSFLVTEFSVFVFQNIADVYHTDTRKERVKMGYKFLSLVHRKERGCCFLREVGSRMKP